MHRVSSALVLILLLASAPALFAQSDRKTEISVTYSNLQAQGLPDKNNSNGIFGTDFFNNRTTLHGFDAEVTTFPTGTFGLTGDFSFNENRRSDDFFLRRNSLRTDIFYFTGGPTVSFARSGRLQPFARFLAGAAHTRFDVTSELSLLVGNVTNSFKTGTTDFALTAGGGLDWRLSDHLKLRVIQVDYAPVFLRDQSINTLTAAGALQPFTLNGQRMDNVRFGFGIVF
jgi:opacity protein-like surface antigen